MVHRTPILSKVTNSLCRHDISNSVLLKHTWNYSESTGFFSIVRAWRRWLLSFPIKRSRVTPGPAFLPLIRPHLVHRLLHELFCTLPWLVGLIKQLSLLALLCARMITQAYCSACLAERTLSQCCFVASFVPLVAFVGELRLRNSSLSLRVWPCSSVHRKNLAQKSGAHFHAFSACPKERELENDGGACVAGGGALSCVPFPVAHLHLWRLTCLRAWLSRQACAIHTA